MISDLIKGHRPNDLTVEDLVIMCRPQRWDSIRALIAMRLGDRYDYAYMLHAAFARRDAAARG